MKKGRRAWKGKSAKWHGKKGKQFRDVHSFKLTGNETSIVTVPGTPANVATKGPGLGVGNLAIDGNGLSRFGGIYIGTFSACTQFNQLNTLFDRYKIHGIKVTFIPEWNIGFTTATSSALPVMKVVHDYDDSSVPTVGDVWARQGKIYRLTRPVSCYIRPKIANTVYNGAVTSAYSVAKAPYLNMSYGSVPHYGLKFAVKDLPTGAVNTIRVETTYSVS